MPYCHLLANNSILIMCRLTTPCGFVKSSLENILIRIVKMRVLRLVKISFATCSLTYNFVKIVNCDLNSLKPWEIYFREMATLATLIFLQLFAAPISTKKRDKSKKTSFKLTADCSAETCSGNLTGNGKTSSKWIARDSFWSLL